MDTFDDSVGRIVSLLGGAAKSGERPSAFCIGRVLQSGNGALRIECNGLQLTATDIWLAEPLDYKWTVDDGSAELLRTGDRVVLLSADGQDYYLIARVVRA